MDIVKKDTQSERRMLSPVLKRIPWTTDVMQVLEELDPEQRNGVGFIVSFCTVFTQKIDNCTGNNL